MLSRKKELGVRFPGKKHYEGVGFNVICVTRGWVWVKFLGKNRYVTLEWPLKRQMGFLLSSLKSYIMAQIYRREGPFKCYVMSWGVSAFPEKSVTKV